MGKDPYKQLRFRVHPDIHAAVEANAKRREEDMSVYCRRIIENAVAEDAANDGLDLIKEALRETLKDVLQPQIERLAKINSKTNIQAGMSLHLLLESLEMANVDIIEAAQTARKKAVADLQARGD